MTEIEISQRLQGRPKYNGFPVPFNVKWDLDTGVPDFADLDPMKHEACLSGGFCGLCGQKLEGDFCFIGGPASLETGVFNDPPMHEECGSYAFDACPFITGRKDYRPDPLYDAIVEAHRPAKMYLMRAKSYRRVIGPLVAAEGLEVVRERD